MVFRARRSGVPGLRQDERAGRAATEARRRKSPASSLAVARLLTRVLPRVEVVGFDALGHMGPITHPEIVNDAIGRFLERI